MNIKENLKEILHDFWIKTEYDKPTVIGGKKWIVGKMSYNEYYLEPFRKGVTERNNFSKNTLWQNSDSLEILQMLIDDKILSIKRN